MDNYKEPETYTIEYKGFTFTVTVGNNYLYINGKSGVSGWVGVNPLSKSDRDMYGWLTTKMQAERANERAKKHEVPGTHDYTTHRSGKGGLSSPNNCKSFEEAKTALLDELVNYEEIKRARDFRFSIGQSTIKEFVEKLKRGK